jgi:hypothetical protein
VSHNFCLVAIADRSHNSIALSEIQQRSIERPSCRARRSPAAPNEPWGIRPLGLMCARMLSCVVAHLPAHQFKQLLQLAVLGDLVLLERNPHEFKRGDDFCKPLVMLR